MPYPRTGGGGGRATFVPTQSPFADIAARDTWAAANLSDLHNDSEQVTVVEVTGVATYEWGGTDNPSTYNANQWFQMTASGVTVSPTLSSFEVPMLNANNELVPSGVRRLQSGTGDLEFDETAQFPQDSVQIGYSGVMSAFGAVPQMRSFVSGRRIIQPFTYWSKAAGSERTREITLAPTDNLVANSDDSTNVPQSGTFSIQATASEALTDLYGRMPVGTGITNFRFRARVQGQTEPFYYYPNRASYESNAGVDFADTTNTPNQIQINIESTPIIVFEAQTIEIDYAMDTGNLLGDGTVPYIAVDRNVITLTDLAYRSELSGPSASIRSFAIQNQPTHVEIGEVLSGSQTFTYAVENPQLVAGNGTITQDGATVASNVSPSDTSITAGINSVTFASGTSSVFVLTFTGTDGRTISRSFTVQAREQSETLYYGTMDTNDPANVDVSALETQMVRAGTQFNADFDTPNTHYYVILSPADREISSILERTFSTEVLSTFTKSEGVRTIGGQAYDSYVRQNNSGVQGTLATTITVS